MAIGADQLLLTAFEGSRICLGEAPMWLLARDTQNHNAGKTCSKLLV